MPIKHGPSHMPATVPPDAEVARLREENAELLAEVREWVCTECNTVFPPESLNKGFRVVLCPRCEGITMPRYAWEVKRLRAQLALKETGLDLARERIKDASDLAMQYGMIDGAHHKQWVIDQMLRTILGPLYDEWRHKVEHATDEEGELYPLWDDGIPP